jgi:class 3 adenylate cyclase
MHIEFHNDSFLARLRRAGIEPTDSSALKVKKTIMVFAMALMTAAPVCWLALYWKMGLQWSSTLPLTYQVVSICSLIFYVYRGGFERFSYIQLGLILFFPFVVQLSIGNFISASGAVLWGVLAPVTASLVLGARQSMPWFVAFISLLMICGYIDLETVDTGMTRSAVSVRTITAFFALNFIAISAFVYWLIHYSSSENDQHQEQLRAAHDGLSSAQQRSEKLLLNILPRKIAERLKEEPGIIADGHADVSVLFADIVDFTSKAEGMSPSQVFVMLNRVFSHFDELCSQHRLEKIKTIGDAYMAAGGLHQQLDFDYTAEMVRMAINMQRALSNDPLLRSMSLQVRIGIATGPVIAGVLGTNKFIYDLWGDTVNLASRITAESPPGSIQVDVMTWRRLRKQFGFQPPLTLQIKGKGPTLIYRLVNPLPNPSEANGRNAQTAE